MKDHKARLELQDWHRIYQEEKANIKGRLDVLYWKGETTKRNVSGSMRKRVLERDANCCVVCGSREKLEVDHKRALMNGGDNRINNLSTLCDPCHTEKTRMDNSLRGKRKKSD